MKKLENLNIVLSPNQQKLFEKFTEIFTEYNEKVNLVSSNDVKYIFEKHIYDSLSLNLFVQKYFESTNKKLLDIGTGGGFPSVPLAILFSDMSICALDSIKKKINFVEFVSNQLKLVNIKPICQRAEDLPFKYKNNFDIVCSRAMAELRIILEYAIPFVKLNGYFAAYKSVKANEEIIQAQNAIKILNAELIDKIEYTLPLEEPVSRSLLIFKKIKNTPPEFPRQNNLIRKKPL